MITITTVSELEKIFDKESEDVSNTKELFNVLIRLKPNDAYENSLPPNESDGKERTYLLENLDYVIKQLKENKNTRKAIMYNLFPSNLIHNCCSIFHFIHRNDILNLNIYSRSMNFEDNMKYDFQTFDQLLSKVSKETNLSMGDITIFIASLHKFI